MTLTLSETITYYVDGKRYVKPIIRNWIVPEGVRLVAVGKLRVCDNARIRELEALQMTPRFPHEGLQPIGARQQK